MIETRETQPRDAEALERLYPAAFPEEDLRPLVRALLAEPSGVLSLVACAKGHIIGHIALTECRAGGRTVALLAPLAVTPHWQRRGVGGALIRAGLGRLRGQPIERVLVLGDPGYYARHGFRTETGILPPYPLPPEWFAAWQSLGLAASGPFSGMLEVPPPWRHRVLWSP